MSEQEFVDDAEQELEDEQEFVAKAIEFGEPKKNEVKTIPLSSIIAYDNPRHEPANLYEMGFTLIGDPSVEEASEDGSQRVSLIHMALSDDESQYKYYCKLIEEYEGRDDENIAAPHSIIQLAEDIELYGQLYPILIVEEEEGVRVIDGGRRIAAILYLHAKNKLSGAEDSDSIFSLAVVDATTKKCSPEEVFKLSLAANISRKEFGPLQQGRIYHEILKQTNPETGKHWTRKEAAQYLGVNVSTFRLREALWHPKDPNTGKGLTDAERAKVAAGKMLLTAASRKALGEKHYSENTDVTRTRNKPIPLKEIQKKFDETDETNDERRLAFAECMGLTLEQAIEESDKRISGVETTKRRKKKEKEQELEEE